MAADPLLVTGFFLFLVAVGCLIASSDITAIIRIRRTPRKAINALPQAGSFEIVGKAQGDSITSPISETPCVFWQVEVKEKKMTGRGGTYWETIFRKSCQEPFEIRDETGNIKISPQRSSFFLKDGLEDSSGRFNEKLEKLNINTKTEKDWGSNKQQNRSFKVYERLIQTNEQVYVLAEMQEMDKVSSFAERISPYMIGDRSEQVLLDTLNGQVVTKVFLTLLVGGIIMYAVLNGSSSGK